MRANRAASDQWVMDLLAEVVLGGDTGNTTTVAYRLRDRIRKLAVVGDPKAAAFDEDRSLEGYRVWARAGMHRTAAIRTTDNNGRPVTLPAAIGTRGVDPDTGKTEEWHQQTMWQVATWDEVADWVNRRQAAGNQALAQAARVSDIVAKYYREDARGPWDAIEMAGDDPYEVFGIDQEGEAAA